jgi:protein gp37
MGKTKIDYATKVWNPVEGCAPCSPGCDNCWARRQNYTWACRRDKIGDLARRVKDWDGSLAETGRWNEPFSWKRPQRVFACSRTDIGLFYPDAWFNLCLTMRNCPNHRFLLLTKRQYGVYHLYHSMSNQIAFPANAWLGVTVCNQEEAAQKIPSLLTLPNKTQHWVSVEPMLDYVDLSPWLHPAKIGWVVCGGESAPRDRVRPIHVEWVHDLMEQCQAAGVPFYFKQWGNLTHTSGGDVYLAKNHFIPTLFSKEYRELPDALKLEGEA